MVFLKGCLWYFYGIPTGFQKDVYGISMIFLCGFCFISMGFLSDVHDFLPFFYDISMGLLWRF